MNHLSRCLLLMMGLLLLRPLTAHAETFDIPSGDTAALIAAMNAANANGFWEDVINLEMGVYTLTEVDNVYEKIDIDRHEMFGGGANGLPVAFGKLLINGNGATIQRADDAPDFRILLVDGEVTINNLTIRNGRATDTVHERGVFGGAILAFGNLNLNAVTIADNYAEAGGGIGYYHNLYSLRINQSKIINNYAKVEGGGLKLIAGNLDIENSTFSDNVTGIEMETFGGVGGGLSLGAGKISIRNSTISGNRAVGGGGLSGLGGGLYIYARPLVTIDIIQNTTISNNTALRGGGVFDTSGGVIRFTNVTIADNVATDESGGVVSRGGSVIRFRNSLIAGNVQSNCHSEYDLQMQMFFSDGNNLDSDGSCGLHNNDLSNVDAYIGPLQYNGGVTETHALLPGSPAINRANSAVCPPRDQRGASRVSVCDIGSFEMTSTLSQTAPTRNQYTTFTPELTWNPIPWATGYAVEIDDNSAFNSPYWRDNQIDAGTLTAQPDKPLWNGPWYWRVRARRSDGSWGGWSAIGSFYVNVTPAP